MKKIWSTDSQDIRGELAKIKEKGDAITLCREGEQSRAVFLNTHEERGGGYYLVLEKRGTFSVSGKQCLFFYKPTEYLTRGFQGMPGKETDHHFSILLPTKIFEIGMRKFPRVTTPNSCATFSLRDKTKLFHCAVLDVSLEGAMLAGNVPRDMKKGDVVGPISMNLLMKFGSDETQVHIVEATVMNVVFAEGNMENKVGLHFHEDAASQATLSPYIDIRIIEDSVKKDG